MDNERVSNHQLRSVSHCRVKDMKLEHTSVGTGSTRQRSSLNEYEQVERRHWATKVVPPTKHTTAPIDFLFELESWEPQTDLEGVGVRRSVG